MSVTPVPIPGVGVVGQTPDQQKLQALANTDNANLPWQVTLLLALGAPNSTNNIGNLNAWNACEGNNCETCHGGGSGLPINNPFNTTLAYGGGHPAPGNSASVKVYPDLITGIAATVATIENTKAFAPILAALKADAPRKVFAAAVGNSGWGTGGDCIAGSSGAPAAGNTDQITSGAPPSGSGGGDIGAATPGLNIPSASDLFGGLGNILGAILSKGFWYRLGIGAGGILLIIIGAIAIFSETKTGQNVETAAIGVASE